MRTTVYLEWLYLKKGDIIKLSDGKELVYTDDYDHAGDGVLILHLTDFSGDFKYHMTVHKKALIPVLVIIKSL